MNEINLAAEYSKELVAETDSTRKCLERIPGNLFDYKPHEKSMPLGYLALLVAEVPKWIYHMIEDQELDFATFAHFKPRDTTELVAHFNDNVEMAKKSLEGKSNESLAEAFHLKNNGQIVYSAPRKVHIGSTLNHWVHHRGQLTVYMRLNDIPVPSIYGPSADDRGF